jgi:gas vesicle protein
MAKRTFWLGAAAGAILAYVSDPQNGKERRVKIRETANKLYQDGSETYGTVSEEVKKVSEDLKPKLQDAREVATKLAHNGTEVAGAVAGELKTRTQEMREAAQNLVVEAKERLTGENTSDDMDADSEMEVVVEFSPTLLEQIEDSDEDGASASGR